MVMTYVELGRRYGVRWATNDYLEARPNSDEGSTHYLIIKKIPLAPNFIKGVCSTIHRCAHNGALKNWFSDERIDYIA
jgi:hypothetical protein